MATTRSERPVLNDLRAARVHEAIHSKRMEGVHGESIARSAGARRAADRSSASAPARDR
jgi:hypothetical protein